MLRGALLTLLILGGTGPASGDLSAFVAAVGFDEEAHLDGGMGLGVRWGKSTGLLGGETALMIARPTRQLDGSDESATAIFYEARILLNLPLGTEVKPFVSVGFGLISLTSTSIPTSQDDAVDQALSAVADAQTNRSFSYGFGGLYELGDRFDLRVDIRQYSVFSVKALASRVLQDEVEDRVGVELPGSLVEDQTVQYNELSVGLNFHF